MTETEITVEEYIGRLVNHELEDSFYMAAEVTGARTKRRKKADGSTTVRSYVTRRWYSTFDPDKAYGFDVNDYGVGNVDAILQAVDIVKDHIEAGYTLEIVRYRLRRELMVVGKTADALTQLAMQAE